MTIQFQCSLTDYKEANRGHLRARVGRWWVISLVPMLTAIFLAALLFAESSKTPSVQPSTTQSAGQSPFEAMMSLFPWLFLVAFFGTFAVMLSRRNRRRFTDVSRTRRSWYSPAMMIWSGVTLFTLLYTLCGLLANPDAPGASRSERIVNDVLPFLIWVAVIVFLYFAVFKNLMKKRWAMQQNMARPKTLEYSARQVGINDELVDNTYRWHAFVRVIETENLFLLYPSELTFHMIPKRAFPSVEATDGFRRLIGEWADGQTVGFPVIAKTTEGT